MRGRADLWIRRTTIGCVIFLALIAGTVSYLHMHTLVALHGQPVWVAALTPLSVDGMIVAASTTLLADSRSGHRGRTLPWALLIIAAWSSFALTAYRIGDYLGWVEIVRRGLQFLDLGQDANTYDLVERLDLVRPHLRRY